MASVERDQHGTLVDHAAIRETISGHEMPYESAWLALIAHANEYRHGAAHATEADARGLQQYRISDRGRDRLV